MGQFDLKKAVVKFVDGRKAALTTTAGTGVNGEITLTDVTRHRGTQDPVTITLVDPGTDHSLSVVVTGLDIVVTLGYSLGAIDTTASALKTFLDGQSDVTDLVVITLAGSGAALVSAQVQTPLATGARTLSVKIAEGTISYDEKVARKYTKDRGILSGIMNADQEPMDVKIDAIWEFLTASTGSGTPTPEDVVKQRGEAATWVSTDEDDCNPFCIDIEIHYSPNCDTVEDEFITLPYFRYESINHDFKNAVVAMAGKCNVTQATVVRQ
jgi:hypothetical protein